MNESDFDPAARMRMVGYAAGSFGAGLYATVPSILLLYYLTQTLGMSVGGASLAILLPKLAVIFADPAIGAWSDGTRTRYGGRTPFLLAGTLLSAFAFVNLFNNRPGMSDSATFLTVSLGYLALSLAHSLFAVPYIAIPAELTADAALRARIIGLRMSFVFAGVLAGAALPPVLVAWFGGGLDGYAAMSILVALLCLVSMLTSVAAIAGLPKRTQVIGEQAEPGSLRSVLRYPPYVAAATTYFLAITGSAVASASAPYFIVYVLGWPDSELAILFGAQIGASILAMAGWARALKRLRYSSAMLLALALAAAGQSVFWIASGSQPSLLVGASMISGTGAAGVQVAAFSLLADVIRRHSQNTGRHLEGLMTGLWTASEKVAFALGPALCGGILAIAGFISRAPATAQPDSATLAIRIAIVLAPLACWAAAALLIAFVKPLLAGDLRR